jgi:hypothetical protein
MAELAQIGSVARQIRQERREARRAFVHTARPLPEGLTALAAQMSSWRAAPYVTWVHGEDLAVALTSREHGWLAKQVCRRASSVLCNSRFSANIVGSLGVAAQRIKVVHPGVDADRFRPDVDGSAERAAFGAAGPVLLSVGRLQRRKGTRHDDPGCGARNCRVSRASLCHRRRRCRGAEAAADGWLSLGSSRLWCSWARSRTIACRRCMPLATSS